MIERALDHYNRTRPIGEKAMTSTMLAETVIIKIGKPVTNSSITSMKQTFRRIDRKEQDTISVTLLIALTEIFAVDFNTLFEYWIDNTFTDT